MLLVGFFCFNFLVGIIVTSNENVFFLCLPASSPGRMNSFIYWLVKSRSDSA